MEKTGGESFEPELPVELPVEKYTSPTPEQQAEMDAWVKKHPYEDIPLEMRRDHQPEKAKFEDLLAEFAASNSLESLSAIGMITPELCTVFEKDRGMTAEQIETALAKLTPEEAEQYRIRAKAKAELVPIVTLLNKLHDETDIAKPDHDQLKVQYKILSRAVGMINGFEIDHAR